MRKVPLGNRVRRLCHAVKADLGHQPILFLDTGAIIDLEEKRRQLNNGDRLQPSDLYGTFHSEGVPLYVTSEVLEEVQTHNRCTLSGVNEIDDETHRLAKRMQRAWTDLLGTTNKGDRSLTLDQVRYDTSLGYYAAFGKGHKKLDIDPISETDRELITAALWSKGLIQDSTLRSISGVGVLTSDTHVADTIDFLTSSRAEGRKYNGVKAYNTRKIW